MGRVRPRSPSARPRLAFGALLVLAVAVGGGTSQAGVEDIPDRVADEQERAIDGLRDRLGEGGVPDTGERCPHALERVGQCHPHVDGAQDDFLPLEGGEGRRRDGAGRKRHADEHHDHDKAATSHAGGTDHATGQTLGHTTLERTIEGTGAPADGFQTLRLAGGEARIVREELAEAKPGRAERRRSLLYVGQTTDWQLADEESPARVELLDVAANAPFPKQVSAAWRPQEALGPAAVEQSVRQLNSFADAGPVPHAGGAHARMDMVLMTGDQADNQQLNETDWVVRLLEGGPIDPNSGTDPSACPEGQEPSGQTADPELYAGVQDYDDYAEGQQFYDPDEPAGPKYSDWPTYTGLMDRAQEEFVAERARCPLIRGARQPRRARTGQPEGRRAVRAGGGGLYQATRARGRLDGGRRRPRSGLPGGAADLEPRAGHARAARRASPVRGPGPVQGAFRHGRPGRRPRLRLCRRGRAGRLQQAATYYAFTPKPGIRLIALETNCDGGVVGPSASGNIDDPQFRWLEDELERASERDQLVIVYGHHPIRSLDCEVPDETPPPCTKQEEHGHDVNPGCDADPRSSTPLHFGDDLTGLFHRFPLVIAYVAGHTHENATADFDDPGGGPGDFWGIETASLVDWPPQNRLIQFMDNCDGTLSIFGTTLDSAAPATAPASGTDAGGLRGEDLGSISRTLAYNDPQAGAGSGEGQPRDRNVELLVEDPRRDAPPCKRNQDDPPGPPQPPQGGPSGSAPADGLGSLPFTGLALGGLALAAAILLASGAVTRRLARRRR